MFKYNEVIILALSINVAIRNDVPVLGKIFLVLFESILFYMKQSSRI